MQDLVLCHRGQRALPHVCAAAASTGPSGLVSGTEFQGALGSVRSVGYHQRPRMLVPGAKGCPKKSLAETFGMDYCPGDDELLKFVGKPGYRDPACDFQDAAPASDDPHKGQRE